MVTSIDLNTTARKVYYVRLDSRAASEVNGVKTLEVYDLVMETEMGYYRKDNWNQSKFEDTDHRMMTTMLQNARSGCISDLLRYRSVFEESFVEKYQLGHCRIDYIGWDPGGKERFYGSKFKD